MLDLSAAATAAWLKTNEPSLADEPFGLPRIRHSPQLEETLAYLGEVLTRADGEFPDRFCAYLQSKSSVATLRTLMVHIDPARMLRLLHWFACPSHPQRHDILKVLLAQGSQANPLDSLLRLIGRVSLINSLFAANRVDLLHAACRSLATEAL